MSRRDSCVWHPMPEDVRRWSTQSRRTTQSTLYGNQDSNKQNSWANTPLTQQLDDSHENSDNVCNSRADVISLQGTTLNTSIDSGAPAPAMAAPTLQKTSDAAVEEQSDSSAAAAPAGADTEEDEVCRVRHTVRFRGDKWPLLLQKHRSKVESTFLADLLKVTSLHAKDAQKLKMKMEDCLHVTFLVNGERRSRQREIHRALQSYSFPMMNELHEKCKA